MAEGRPDRDERCGRLHDNRETDLAYGCSGSSLVVTDDAPRRCQTCRFGDVEQPNLVQACAYRIRRGQADRRQRQEPAAVLRDYERLDVHARYQRHVLFALEHLFKAGKKP